MAEALGRIDGIADVRASQSADGYPAWRISGGSDITPAIFALANEHDWALRELRRDTVTLESFFKQLATTA